MLFCFFSLYGCCSPSCPVSYVSHLYYIINKKQTNKYYQNDIHINTDLGRKDIKFKVSMKFFRSVSWKTSIEDRAWGLEWFWWCQKCGLQLWVVTCWSKCLQITLVDTCSPNSPFSTISELKLVGWLWKKGFFIPNVCTKKTCSLWICPFSRNIDICPLKHSWQGATSLSWRTWQWVKGYCCCLSVSCIDHHVIPKKYNNPALKAWYHFLLRHSL